MSPAALQIGAAARAADGRAVRGAATRERLLRVATQIFATHGYRAASTRDICEAAQANPAAIHYHFSDKAGLYRAVMLAPISAMCVPQALADDGRAEHAGPLAEALAALYASVLGALRSGDPIVMQHVQLHFRELADPSGVLGDALVKERSLLLGAVAELVRKALGLAELDDDVRRLVFCMVGMAFDFYGTQAEREAFAPAMLTGPADVDLLVQRLTMFGCAMVDAERRRRESGAAR